MLHWRKVIDLPDEELAAYDVAELNLACATDLPDTGAINQDLCLHKLDYWARCVRQFTEPRMQRFRRNRWEYGNSEGYFRILCMITVLQRDLGLRYNLAKIPDDVPLESDDSFIHGALFGDGGTCGTMAVVYVAVGRRLGYPLKLVAAKRSRHGHLFPRWDDPKGERFNIEASNKGLTCYPDDYYRTGHYAIDPEIERRACLLKSMTVREELAHFLAARGYCWLDHGSHRRAVESFVWGSTLAPRNEEYIETAKALMNRWAAKLRARTPPSFPVISIGAPRRRFPDCVPLDIERHILGLEAGENLLNNSEHEQGWWGPLRAGLRPRSPTAALADFSADGSCHIRFRFSVGNPGDCSTKVGV